MRATGTKEVIKKGGVLSISKPNGSRISAGQVKCVGFSYCCLLEGGHEMVLASERIGKGEETTKNERNCR